MEEAIIKNKNKKQKLNINKKKLKNMDASAVVAWKLMPWEQKKKFQKAQSVGTKATNLD